MVGPAIAGWLKAMTDSPFLFVCLVMLLLVVIGMFMEANAAYVMLVPIIAPIAVSYGLDPVYFGFLFVMNITLGAITPPVGILLFVSSGIWKIKMAEILKEIWPFVIVQYIVLLLCMIFPDIILILPRLAGY
jgi:C4-dicarboxylate transporter DctM subunit